MTIRVLCVDDHTLLLEGLQYIIAREPDLSIVGCATNGIDGVDLFRTHRPDITLMDLQLPGMSGLDATKEIRRIDPNARIIVLTTYQGTEDMFRALRSGATTYLMKDTLSTKLVQVIRDVHAGKQMLDTAVQDRLAARAAHPQLSDREIQIIALVSKGLSNKEISALLQIGETTVQSHVKNIFLKFQVTDRTAAAIEALRRGIIHLNS